MSNFKKSQKRKQKGNFKENTNQETKVPILDFDFFSDMSYPLSFGVIRDFENIELPAPNKGLFFFTDRVRNPDILINKIINNEGKKKLIAFVSGTKFFEKHKEADLILTKQYIEGNQRYEIHAKIYIVNDFVIFSSANINNTNATTEQYIIINSKCLVQNIETQLKRKKLL